MANYRLGLPRQPVFWFFVAGVCGAGSGDAAVVSVRHPAVGIDDRGADTGVAADARSDRRQ